MSVLQHKWFVGSLFVIIILPSLFYLGTRIAREDSWDNWDFGSAQTMLTARLWGRDGFLTHYVMFVPSGYHPEAKFLDQPEFRFLADGAKTGGRIGFRMYYNHYPSNYAIPFGVLAKLGIEERIWYRAVSLIFSFASVGFMAAFLYQLFDKKYWISIIGVFYYVTSTTFLGYADSLANMPMDDFFKWLILFLSIYLWKKENGTEQSKKWISFGIWIAYFILASVSYDSTFFIFVWLCGLSWTIYRSIRWREWLGWAMAPVCAFVIQMLQNAWYLGWNDMLLDLWGAFLSRSNQAPAVLGHLPPLVKNLSAALSTFGYMTGFRTRVILPLILALIGIALYKKIFSQNQKLILGVLAIAGLVYGTLLPIVGTFGYQGRQVAPLFVAVVGYITWLVFQALWRREWTWHALASALLVVMIWGMRFQSTAAYAREWPNNLYPNEALQYFTILGTVTDLNTMIVGTEASLPKGSSRFFEQYYADRLILSFQNSDELVQYIKKIAKAVDGNVSFLLVLNQTDHVAAMKLLKSLPQFKSKILPEHFNRSFILTTVSL